MKETTTHRTLVFSAHTGGVSDLWRYEIESGNVNINDGRLKDAVENRHGVGEGIWQAVSRLTGMHLAGRRALVGAAAREGRQAPRDAGPPAVSARSVGAVAGGEHVVGGPLEHRELRGPGGVGPHDQRQAGCSL